MESKQVIRVPMNRLVGHTVLALLFGAALPLLASVQLTLPMLSLMGVLIPVLMLGGLLTAYLKLRSGWIPAGMLIGASLISTALFTGYIFAVMLLLAALLPALEVIWNADRKAPFFEQLWMGVLAFVLGLLAAILVAYASFGGGLVAKYMDAVREMNAQLPDELLQPFVDWQNSMLAMESSVTRNMMTVSDFRSQMAGVMDLMQQAYAQALPGALLSGALLSGVLCVLWANWTMARQGLATNESFIGLARWFMPPRIAIGAAALWLIGAVLAASGYPSGATVFLTVRQVTGAGFVIQALCALDRRMLTGGRTQTRRRVLITLLAVACLLMRGVASIMSLAGAASALFGSHGAIRLWMRRGQDNHSNHNDSDE